MAHCNEIINLMHQEAGIKPRKATASFDDMKSKILDTKFLCQTCMSVQIENNKVKDWLELVIPKPTVFSQT